MRTLIFFVSVFSSILFSNTIQANQMIKETVQLQLPLSEVGKWRIESQLVNNDGRIFRVWVKKNENKVDERIVIVSTPYKTAAPSIKRAIEVAILPVKMQLGSHWEILESGEKQAVLKWSIKNEKSAFCKLILGQEALHSISYIYRGKDAQKVDQNKWTTCLKYASLQSSGFSEEISQR